MNQEQNNPQKRDSQMDPVQPVNQPDTQERNDARDAQIKGEPDTARLRSERQSVIDSKDEHKAPNP